MSISPKTPSVFHVYKYIYLYIIYGVEKYQDNFTIKIYHLVWINNAKLSQYKFILDKNVACPD